MAAPRFQYLVFLSSNGFLLLDREDDRPEAIPFLKDVAIKLWTSPTETYTRSQLSILGPLVNFPTEETARNSHRSTPGILSKFVGGVLSSLTYADWKLFLEVDHSNNFSETGA